MTLAFGSYASLSGTFAARPAADANQVGRFYFATDTGNFYRDSGTSWELAGRANYPGMIPVTVTADWATVANCKTDVLTATGFSLPAAGAAVMQRFFFLLWEGPSDPDDFASLMLDSQVLPMEVYRSYTTGVTVTGWASAPTSGTAYIIGIFGAASA